ncbi:MAG: acetyl-CoA carboxylase biotin carboxylase subunit [Calditrichaeota bacterium]|nr:MAG: acetyl-CoA carboxylase biotin carboxylase subunit [Calditrichota bacterium]MBL1204502.1 acetyl-CoA carboxylase biotin carboxylase subunit [Calditrichota bacterium]NOG44331.1 acetyl-CoA carboxylase biotin carboxylase subunit [Calditrichota bacterium]
MFKKILIANRGEIALRVIRTCNEMGIKSVAVYSDVDRKSPFVYSAYEAYALGGKTSQESYLQWQKILDIAKNCGAEAIHPGYGFMSENAEFAEAVEKAGMVFIGPKAESIRTMGNKTAARTLMIANKVPTVPGTEDAITDSSEAQKVARKIGYPVLVKAAAGGGGKGMRLVEKDEDFIEAVEGAAREAKAAFNDDAVYIEKFVEEPRHIEFQILADKHGNVVHLGERECSIQRRHQKVIEEAPSSLLDDDLRKKMGEAAINTAKACNYQNAGTIEFLVDKNRNFYFLEMNTRLQVEHPVTEMVNGLDLVEEQIHIAAGEKLRIKQSSLKFWGHAFECRLYAEDPDNNWAPSPGVIEFLNPADGPGIREDSGVTMGSEISLYYDPMISKLCAWGQDRKQAMERMKRALREYQIGGIKTSIPFLIRVFEHPKFQSGDFTTKFIEEYTDSLFSEPQEFSEIAALAAILGQMEEKKKVTLNTPNSGSSKKSNWKTVHRRNAL